MKFLIIKKGKCFKAILLLAILATALFFTNYTQSYVIVSGKAARMLPIYCVDTNEKVVSLSFDAAWGADKTLKILGILEEYDIRANFFVVGFWAEKQANELKQLADSGRVEIGTHSNTHPHMGKLSKSAVKLELETSIASIKAVTGSEVELFRPPFGEYSDTLLTTATELGLYTIQWDVDSLDWKDLSADQIASRILSRTQNGSIVLMHNDAKHIVEALPLIIEGLKQKGFGFRTIGELIMRDNYSIDHTGKQIRSI